MAAVWLIYNVLDTELYGSILCPEGGQSEVFKMSGHDGQPIPKLVGHLFYLLGLATESRSFAICLHHWKC